VPNFRFWEPFTCYYVNNTIITNITFRAVVFSRGVDGLPVIGMGAGGNNEIYFGEYHKIEKISLTWPKLERYKSYPAVTKKTVGDFIRQGKARQGLLPGNVGELDWQAVKSMTIKKVWPSYFSGSTDWLYPYLALWTTVDTGHGTVDLEIDTPIIDETKL